MIPVAPWAIPTFHPFSKTTRLIDDNCSAFPVLVLLQYQTIIFFTNSIFSTSITLPIPNLLLHNVHMPIAYLFDRLCLGLDFLNGDGDIPLVAAGVVELR